MLRPSAIGITALTFILTGAFLVFAEEDLASRIRTIQAELQRLEAQLKTLQAETPTPCEFSRDLFRGVAGEDVKCLQRYLNASGFSMASSGPGSSGNETDFFGRLTKEALIRWQAANGIKPAAGYFGPISRTNYKVLSASLPAPTPPPPPTLVVTPAAPPATTTAPTPPPPSPTPPSPPVELPTPGQLGLPLITFFGWGQNDIRVQFTHDPGAYARSYAIYLKNPSSGATAKLGPYVIPADIGGTATTSAGIIFRRSGPVGFEWENPFDFAANSDGTYEVFVKAVGDGGVESLPSPGRIITLLPPIVFENLLQDSPLRDVINSVVSKFPLTIRLSNPHRDLYYRYELLDGSTLVWDTAYLKQSTTPKIEAVFTNVNQYQFSSGKAYRIRADSFDNDSGRQSETKQKPAEITFTYSP